MTSSHKIFLFLAILASCAWLIQANTLDSSEITQNYGEYFGLNDPQEISSILGMVKDLKDIFSQITHIRHTVDNSSIETMEIMDLFNFIETGPVCNSCQKFVGTIRNHLEDQKALHIVEKTAEFFCSLGMDKNLCKQAINTYGPISLTSLVDKFVSPQKFCQGFFLCPHTHNKETVKQYAKEILKDKPMTNIPKPNGKSTYNILQLADPHVDLRYEAENNAFCSDPLCCRAESGAPKDPSQASQYWGTISKCDLPMRTFEQFLQFVSKNFEFDFILWTGDNIAHDIWNQTQDTQTVNTYDITQEIMKYFPNTTVYPMFGNHEAYPGDDFDTVGNESDWLLASLSDMWKPWLDEQALETFRKNSYYSTVNKKLNVKIIALDTQACDTANFYLMRAPTDPLHELEWLRNELYDSESKNQSVIIMGHIPPGTPSCDSEWSGRYSALVERFTNIIRGQYFAHTHNDHIEIIRGPINDAPVGTVFIAPSFTTYTNLKPSFRIIEVDAETHQPVNIYQYRLDLDKWNKNTTGPIEWDLAYNFLDEYQVKDLSNFEELDKLADRLKEDTDLAQTYVFNYVSGAQPRTKLTKRETQHFYCQAKNGVYIDMLKCLGLQAKVGDILLLAGQLLPGAWEFSKC